MNKQVKSILGSLLFIGAVAFAPSADAGFLIGAQKIKRIAMQNDAATANMAYVEFDGSRTGNPSCASSHPRKFIFDTSSNRGKALLSMLTAAMYAQRPVYATGTNACAAATSFADANSQVIELLRAATVER